MNKALIASVLASFLPLLHQMPVLSQVCVNPENGFARSNVCFGRNNKGVSQSTFWCQVRSQGGCNGIGVQDEVKTVGGVRYYVLPKDLTLCPVEKGLHPMKFLKHDGSLITEQEGLLTESDYGCVRPYFDMRAGEF